MALEALPSRVQGRNPGNFCLFCILNSSKHCSLGSVTRNVDKSLHQKSILLNIWGFEFGIPNWYIGFKIALDMHWLCSSTKMLKSSLTSYFKYLAMINFPRKTNILVIIDLLAGSCICTCNKLIKAKAIFLLTFSFKIFFLILKLTSKVARVVL